MMRDYDATVKNLREAAKGLLFDAMPYRASVMRDAAGAIEELLAKIDELWTQLRVEGRSLIDDYPRWISVEDEPPKENGRYLVRYKRDVDLGDGETVHEDEIRIMRFFVGEGWRYPIICNDHVRLVNEEVTRWMPLPAPPKEVQDG